MIGNTYICYFCSSELVFKGCLCDRDIKLIGNNCLAHHISDKNIDHDLIDINLALRMQTDPSLLNLYLDDLREIKKASEFLRENSEQIKSYKTLVEVSKRKLISHIEETFASLDRMIEEVNYEINIQIKNLNDYKTSLCGEGRLLINEYKAKNSRGLLENNLKSVDIPVDEILDFITNSIRIDFTHTTIKDQPAGKHLNFKLQLQDKDSPIKKSPKAISDEKQVRYINSQLSDPSKINKKAPTVDQSTIPKQEFSIKDYNNTFELVGHRDRVFCMSMSGDSRLIVTGSEDRTVRIWNMETKLQEAVFDGHISWVLSVCMSSDGRWIASGGYDNTIRVWNVERKSEEAVLVGHEGGVFAVCMSRDDCWIVSGSGDNTVRIWSMDNKTQEAVLTGHTDCILSVCISCDDKWIVSGGRDNTLRIWNMDNKSQEAVLTGHTNWVNSVCSVPDGSRIISSSSDNTVRIWNIVNKSQEIVFDGHLNSVNSVCISGDGEWVASASFDGKVIIWSMLNKCIAAVLTGTPSRVISAFISGDGSFIASWGGDNTVKIWTNQ